MSNIENRLGRILSGDIRDDDFGVEALKDLSALAILSEASDLAKADVARQFIEAVFHADQNALNGYLGIQIYERAENRPNNEDCHGYVFGSDSNAECNLTDLFINYDLSAEHVDGAIALYFNDDFEPQHVGIAEIDGKVRSKWGLTSHVFVHEPLFVPPGYGWHIAYFSPRKNCHPMEQAG